MSQVNIQAFYDTQQADNSSGNRYAEASQVKKNIWIFPFIVWSTFSFKKMKKLPFM